MNRFFRILLMQLLIVNNLSFGQTVVRSSLSCFGSAYSEKGLIFRHTAGQSSVTGILKNDGITLRQGFQQPVAQRNTSGSISRVQFSISPNPAKTSTLIRFQEEITECVITVRDLNGTAMFDFRDGYLHDKWLDLKELKPGVYIVTVNAKNGTGSEKLIVTR